MTNDDDAPVTEEWSDALLLSNVKNSKEIGLWFTNSKVSEE
jgi:hypothetical protein